MSKTNDGKSDSSVSYTPVAPLNKEEEIIKLLTDIKNKLDNRNVRRKKTGKHTNNDLSTILQHLQDNPTKDVKYYTKQRIEALLNSQIREARADAIKSYKKVLKAEATLNNKEIK